MTFIVLVAAIVIAFSILQNPEILGRFLIGFSIPFLILIALGIAGYLLEGKPQ